MNVITLENIKMTKILTFHTKMSMIHTYNVQRYINYDHYESST